MCSITKAAPAGPIESNSKPDEASRGLVSGMPLGVVSIVLLSCSKAFGLLSPSHIIAACAAVVVACTLFIWFVNYYVGQNLRKCNPVAKHIAALSKKKSSNQCLVDLDRIANTEGLNQLWKDEVANKGESYHILLTGVTGYVGRAFLYQLLREVAISEASEDSTVLKHKVYVMARAKERKNLSAAQRLEMLRDDPMFQPYKKQWNEVVVAAQSGDLQDVNCGMSGETLSMLADAKITHVVHCAADVNFNRPLADSAGINISPALQLQSLAQQWPTCRRFVHCSTAFVNPGCGSDTEPMAEKLFSLGKYDPQDLYDSMRGDQKLALAVKKEMAFPNNYVFTKCVAEHLVARHNKGMGLKIVRPAIVGPAWVLPEPGWNGDKPSTITALFLLWGTRVIRFAHLSKTPIPTVPVDVVGVSIIHAMITPEESTGQKEEKAEDVSIRNLIWSHKSPNAFMDCFTMARNCVSLGILEQVFSPIEAAVSFALLDTVDRIPLLFPILHFIFNLGPLYILQFICWAVKVCGIKSVLEKVPVVKLLRFSDMITLYQPYMGRDYYFESSINVPDSLDVNQYNASLVVATHSFWDNLFPGTVEGIYEAELLPKGRLDLLWALTCPSGSMMNRLLAYLSCKILRKTHGSAKVDIGSMEDALGAMMDAEAAIKDQKHCVFLATNNQSPMDTLLSQYVSFSLPGTGIDVPSVVPGSSFEYSDLGPKLEDMKSHFDRHACLVAKLPKSKASESFLKTLVKGSRNHEHTVIPVFLDYETNEEVIKGFENLGLWSVFKLYWQVCVQGKHLKAYSKATVSYGKPERIDAHSDFELMVSRVHREHTRLMSISDTHLVAAETDLRIPSKTLKGAVETLGVAVVTDGRSTPQQSDKWDLHKQWIHNFSPYLKESHPNWASIIADGNCGSEAPTTPKNGEIEAVLEAICAIFDAADYLAVRAMVSLHQKNVENPDVFDLVSEMEALDSELKEGAGSFIFEAAASFAVRNQISAAGDRYGGDEKKEY